MAAITRFDTDASPSAGRKDRSMLRPVLMVACAIAITFAASGKVFAQDDDENGDKTPEQTVIDSLMRGIGAKSMDNSGIEYRERSPLVIPPSTALPPPETRAKVVDVPNWPKDPDVTRNKQAAADRKKSAGSNPRGAYRDSDQYPLSSTELNKGRPADGSVAKSATNTDAPGGDPSRPLTPSELGYKGNLFSNWFSLNKKEDVPFEGEPERSSLIQPPTGYQTPSPNYSYGVDPDTKDSTLRPTAAQQRIHDGLPN